MLNAKLARPVYPVTLVAVLLAALAVVTLGGCGGAPAATTQGSGATASSATQSTAPSAASSPSATPAVSYDGVVIKDDPPMKTIGIIGGVSWVSSAEYYRIMNETIRDAYGPDCSAKILMYSIPFGSFSQEERLAANGDWNALTSTMVDAAKRLEAGGADFIVIASNTLNSTADVIELNVKIPVLLIEDPVGEAVKAAGLKTVALLGTKYTMEAPFYRDRLEKKYGLEVVTPDLAERDYINDVIFDQLCAGTCTETARRHFVRIIDRLVAEEGAQGVILGCTEIPLLVKQKDVSVPVFDSTELHAKAAVRYALGKD